MLSVCMHERRTSSSPPLTCLAEQLPHFQPALPEVAAAADAAAEGRGWNHPGGVAQGVDQPRPWAREEEEEEGGELHQQH